MFEERRARFRADSVVEGTAEEVREKCNLATHSNFSVTGLILNGLPIGIGVPISVEKYADGSKQVPAYVNVSKDSNHRILKVEFGVWDRADRGVPKDRFILAHEIGHMVLHSHAELAFCEGLAGHLGDLQDQEKAEHQANHFADCFLVPERMLMGFSDPYEIAEHFLVPLDCADRRFFTVCDRERRARSSLSGEFCSKCMNFSLERFGHTSKCASIECN